MPLTPEEQQIVDRIHASSDSIKGRTRTSLENISNALDPDKAYLAGSGIDTGQGTEVILIVKPKNV